MAQLSQYLAHRVADFVRVRRRGSQSPRRRKSSRTSDRTESRSLAIGFPTSSASFKSWRQRACPAGARQFSSSGHPKSKSRTSKRWASGASPKRDIAKLGTPALDEITWTTVSSFKGLENDVVVLVGVEYLHDDWYRSLAYAGMSRARIRLHVLIHQDADKLRQERERKWQERQESDVEMLL